MTLIEETFEEAGFLTEKTPDKIETIPEAINLYELIKVKKRELDSLETKLSIFKVEMISQLKEKELEAVRKEGYQFTLVKMTKNIFYDDRAWDIVEQSGKTLQDFLTIDKTKFEMSFGNKNGAFEQIDGSEYLKITKVSKK